MAGKPSPTFRSSQCVLLLRNVVAVATCGALALGGLFVTILLLLAEPEIAGIPMLLIALALVAAWSFWKYHYLPTRRSGRLVASERGIELDGREMVTRAELSRGIVVPAASWLPGAKPRVRLLGPTGELVAQVEVPSEADGRALLAAAKLDAAHSVATFRLSSYWLGQTAVVVILAWLPILLGAPLAFGISSLADWLGLSEGSNVRLAMHVGVFGVAALAAVLLFMRAKIVVSIGADGVHLRELRGPRYIPYAEINRLTSWTGQDTPHGRAMSEGFDLVLNSGEIIKLRTAAQRLASGQMDRDVVADQITAGMLASGARDGPSLDPLAQGRRPAGQWVAHLRHLATSAPAYRQGELDDEALWQRLEDAGAEPRERAACAAVLGARDPSAAKLRIEQAAGAVALPELRAALEAAASGDDQALAAALERLPDRQAEP